MKRKQLFLWAVVSAVALGEQAEAPRSAGGSGGGRSGSPVTSVLSGKTLGTGAVLSAQFGFPGLSLAAIAAASDRFDIGGRLSLMYSYEGIARMAGIPGAKLQAVLRLGLLERGKLHLGLRAEPGAFLYGFPGGTEAGIAIPVGLSAGFDVFPNLMLHAGIDLPMFAVFGPYGGFAVPLLIGGGLEYALDRQLGLTCSLRAGPSVPLTGNAYLANWAWVWCIGPNGQPYRCSGYYYSVPAVEALIGLTYKL